MLVACDGSFPSRRALPLGLRHATLAEDELVVQHVIESSETPLHEKFLKEALERMAHRGGVDFGIDADAERGARDAILMILKRRRRERLL